MSKKFRVFLYINDSHMQFHTWYGLRLEDFTSKNH